MKRSQNDFPIPPDVAAKVLAPAEEEHRAVGDFLRDVVDRSLLARPAPLVRQRTPAEAAARMLERRKNRVFRRARPFGTS